MKKPFFYTRDKFAFVYLYSWATLWRICGVTVDLLSSLENLHSTIAKLRRENVKQITGKRFIIAFWLPSCLTRLSRWQKKNIPSHIQARKTGKIFVFHSYMHNFILRGSFEVSHSKKNKTMLILKRWKSLEEDRKYAWKENANIIRRWRKKNLFASSHQPSSLENLIKCSIHQLPKTLLLWSTTRGKHRTLL